MARGKASQSAPAAKVFISYSRKDSSFSEKLLDGLTAAGISAYLDKKDIAAGEEWKKRLGDLIMGADAIVFVVSAASVRSEICRWEIEYAESLGKRIIPAILERVPPGEIPPGLSRRHFIDFDDPARHAEALATLVCATQVDIAWVREHTRLGEIASRWEQRGRKGALLLRAQELVEAEHWLAHAPANGHQVTEAQRLLVFESRRAATRRQRMTVSAALSVAAITLGLAVFALVQKQFAQENEAKAVANEAKAVAQTIATQKSQSRHLAEKSTNATRSGDATLGALLAIEAMPDPDADAPRPTTQEARQALQDAVSQQRLIGSYQGEHVADLLEPLGAMLKEALSDLRGLQNESASTEPAEKLKTLLFKHFQVDAKQAEKFDASKATVGDARELLGQHFDHLLTSVVRGADISPDGSHFVVDRMDGQILVVNSDTMAIELTYPCDPVTKDMSLRLALAQQSRVLWHEDGSITIERFPFEDYRIDGPPRFRVDHSVCAITAAGDVRRLVRSATNFTLWDELAGKPLLSVAIPKGATFEARTSKNFSAMIFQFGDEAVVHLWNVFNGRSVATRDRPIKYEETNEPGFLTPDEIPLTRDPLWEVDPDLACADAKLIDMRTGKILIDMSSPGRIPSQCRIAGVTRRVVVLHKSEKNDRCWVGVWNIDTASLVSNHEIKDTRCWAALDGKKALAVLSGGPSTKIIDLESGAVNDIEASRNSFSSFFSSVAPKWSVDLDEALESYGEVIDKLESDRDKSATVAGLNRRVPQMLLIKGYDSDKLFLEFRDLVSGSIAQGLGPFDGDYGSAYFSEDGNLLHVTTHGATLSNRIRLKRHWVYGLRQETSLEQSPYGEKIVSKPRWQLLLGLGQPDDLQMDIRPALSGSRLLVVRDFGLRVDVFDTSFSGRDTVRISGEMQDAPVVTQLRFVAGDKALVARRAGSVHTFVVDQGSAAATSAWPDPGSPPPAEQSEDTFIAVPSGAEEDPSRFFSVESNAYREVPGSLGAIAVAASGRTGLVATESGEIVALSLPTLTETARLDHARGIATRDALWQLRQLAGFEPAMSVSPDARTAVIANVDGGGTIYDAATGGKIADLEIVADQLTDWVRRTDIANDRYLAVAEFSPDGAVLAGSLMADVSLRLWDAHTGRSLHHLTGHNGRVTAVAFSADGKIVATGSDDATVRLWQVDTGEFLYSISSNAAALTALAFDGSSKHLAMATVDGAITIWKLRSDDVQLVRHARHIVPYCLDQGRRDANFIPPQDGNWCKNMNKPPRRMFDRLSEQLNIDVYATLFAGLRKQQ